MAGAQIDPGTIAYFCPQYMSITTTSFAVLSAKETEIGTTSLIMTEKMADISPTALTV
jgi:hypothetical protein